MHPKIEFDSLATTFKRTTRSPRGGLTLMKAIFSSYRGAFVVLGLLALFITVFTMAAPVLTHRIIGYIKQPAEDRSTEEGLLLVGGITLLALAKALLQSHLYYRFAVLGFNLSNTLSLLVFAKALRYPALCEKKYSMSEIINYSQVDAQRMTNMGTQLTSALYTPLQIIIGVTLMYRYIGLSFAAGMAAMILMIALTFLVAKSISKVNEITLRAKDSRMKITQEILDIIRFIKVNAIEKHFFKQLD
jgi:ABC-type bacteriocin/lantibiotic exporter with double-glycine peptidase domain